MNWFRITPFGGGGGSGVALYGASTELLVVHNASQVKLVWCLFQTQENTRLVEAFTVTGVGSVSPVCTSVCAHAESTYYRTAIFTVASLP